MALGWGWKGVGTGFYLVWSGETERVGSSGLGCGNGLRTLGLKISGAFPAFPR